MIELFKKYKEIIAYLFWGGMTTLVSWGTYALFQGVFGMPVAVANVLSWICAVIFAFFTNKVWVFSSRSFKLSVVLKEAGMFVTSRLITGVIEWVFVPLLVWLGLNKEIYGVEGAWSKIIVSVVVVILNYVFSKLIVFRKGKTKIDD